MTEATSGRGQVPGSQQYALSGVQVEPLAGFWPIPSSTVIRTVRVREFTAVCDRDDPSSNDYFPPYPSDQETAEEIEELRQLAGLRGEPAAVSGGEGARYRRPVSWFLSLTPRPLGAFDRTPTTGYDLARWFESETPGLVYRQAVNYMMPRLGWSPARQTRAWAALDVALHSAIEAAWYYKWVSTRSRVGYRPRPIEVDPGLSVLFNLASDDTVRLTPEPSPGTPRHPSYPSGHSTLAGAGSEVLSYFFPDWRGELDNLADNIGMARLWAGIHYRSDHLNGVRLGRAIGRIITGRLDRDRVAEEANAPVFQSVPSRDRLEQIWRAEGRAEGEDDIRGQSSDDAAVERRQPVAREEDVDSFIPLLPGDQMLGLNQG